MKKHSESGNIVIALLMVGLLLTVALWVVRTVQGVTAADVILRNTVKIAVKGAVNQYNVNKDNGYVRIDFNRAKNVFERMLRKNLELKGNLEPCKYSIVLKRPKYTLIIYNGSSYGNEPAGVIYKYEDGDITEIEIDEEGFPRVFCLSEGLEVELPSPGVIAEVEITSKEIYGEDISCKKWAAAKIEKTKVTSGSITLNIKSCL